MYRYMSASQQASRDSHQVLDCLNDANRNIAKCTTKESENKKLMRFLLNSQKIWATGIFDDLGKALKQDAQANNSRQFWAAYAPRIEKGFTTAIHERDLRENEYLVTYSDDFLLTNETFYLLSNVNVAKKTINLKEIEDYNLKEDSNQWNVTFKLNSGEMVEIKGLKSVPKEEYVEFLRKQILGSQWRPIPIKDKQTLIATAANKELVEFLINTHTIRKRGDLHGLDEVYKKEADSLTPEQFVDRYADQIEKIFNAASKKRKLQGDECLVSHHNGFFLTNKILYLFTKGFEKEGEVKIVNLNEIESYSFKLGIVRDGGIAVKLKSGETIKVRSLKGYPSVESIDFLRK